ncbi:SREBP regulating gene protein isoform X2 [Dromaius novaehollandiae]|uniref:SREBP regulating gene protein isoform X2 n=1 Tax=Dromaius novaehollandiae TaxID=8790 RepID=UPI00311DA243
MPRPARPGPRRCCPLRPAGAARGDGAVGGGAVAQAAAEALGARRRLRALARLLPQQHLQAERTVRDRNLLQVQEHEQPIVWKVQFSLGNSSQLSNQCRNSVQGKLLITDELGYICERKDLLVNGCCNVNVPSTKLYSCDSCLPNGCCSVYEYCVSCCLQPNKQHLLERFLNRAAIAFQNLFMAVEDRFELCLAKCRTSSQSVQHENTYRDPIAKYCYGEYPPELLPV